jgi:restriction system protein
VRQLFGVISGEQASHGVIATTTFFTNGARQEEMKFRHRLSLRDYNDVIMWLRNYKKRKT